MIAPVKMVTRVRSPRGHIGKRLRQQSVAGHDEENPALAIEERQDDGWQRDHRRYGQIAGSPANIVLPFFNDSDHSLLEI